MNEVTILTEVDLRLLVPLDQDAVACVEQAFVALAGGDVVMPPILRLDIREANGEVDVKTAYVPGIESFAIKISPGFFDNPKIGLPSVNGLMVLLSARTGLLEAALLDNGYLTDVRTAAAGAVAAAHLARADSKQAAILGAGVQARLQLKALTLVRPIERATIWARDPQKARTCADALSNEFGFKVSAAADVRDAVGQADIIVTTTPSPEPILFADMLSAGQHVTAMGSDAEHKNEIDPKVFLRSNLVYVPDRLAQVRLLGELHHAIDAGVVAAGAEFAELGAIIAGKRKGRSSAAQITLADLTGMGVQDTAIATLAKTRAVANGAGQIFSA